jgi:peptidoglycan/LPS O-acetylase OafA/YrhL
MHIGYRRDIDGLRFIAVSSVVLFHAGLETMSGGFVGVDIFFVISGYLITCGLFKDADGQGISIARFYERRIKRIIPAYAAVIVATMLAGLFVLLPSQLADLGKSALAATLFVANIHFWTGAGYFAGDPLSHPLLHLWSLAVEEQFYIVWPVFVLLLYRMGLARWRVPLILAGIAVTLVASQLMLGYSAKTAFYMAPLRAWELLVGALLACGHWPRLKAGWMAHAIGALALALILVPMFTYTEASQFPGCAPPRPVWARPW